MTDRNEMKEKYLKAITEGKKELKGITLEESPSDFGRIQNNIGGAYGSLASIGDKPANCKHAIEAFTQALKAFTLKDNPIDYAKTQSNLGNAYGILATVENTDDNCIMSFQAFYEALQVFNESEYPDVFKSLVENIQMYMPVCEKLKRKLDELFNPPAPPSTN